MPTYDYICEKCGHQFEYFQSMNDAKLTDCPLEECDGSVKRLMGTGAGIIFKGSGFYETDYKRGDAYQKAAKADKGESSGSEKGNSGGESGAKPKKKEKSVKTSSSE